MPTLCNVTGRIYDRTGHALPGVKLVFVPRPATFSGLDGDILSPNATVATADGSGDLDFNIAPGIYDVTGSMTDTTLYQGSGQVGVRFVATIPSTASADLSGCIGQIAEIDSSIAGIAIQAALDAADYAQEAATYAGVYEIDAFAELASDFAYSTSPPRKVVTAGDIIYWREYSLAFRVLGSGASSSDLNYTGTGGVKFAVVTGNIRAFGGAPGAAEATNVAAIAKADTWSAANAGERAVVPAGAYDVDSVNTIDFTAFEWADGAALNSVATGDVLVRDRDGSVIGLEFNHRQQSCYSGSYPRNTAATAIVSGNLVSPPLSRAAPTPGVDIVAHWYGRQWGNEWMRTATGIGSSDFDHWYDWGWNWTGSGGYDADRHPVLGWYRQDDPQVLDWQCYWLLEAGVRAICPVSFELNISTWNDPDDVNYWMYQLFYNAPNFKNLAYIPWVQSEPFDGSYSAPTSSQVITQWDNVIFGLCDAFPNNYRMRHRGKEWMTLYCWNSDYLLNTVFGGSVSSYKTFLQDRASAAITRGYAGIAVMFHSATDAGTLPRADLLALNVLYLHSPYSGKWASPSATTYPEVVSQFAPASVDLIPTATTALVSKSPITLYNLTGHTPALFREYLQKCIRHVRGIPNMPDVVTVGNVSEWAESGPGLTPSRGSGWAYLDAIRQAAAREGVYGATLWPPQLLSMSNGWVNYGTGTEPLTVTRGADRLVTISGVIKSGTTTAGTLITTLPTWARPEANQVFPVALDGGFISAVLVTASNGQVTALGALNATLTSFCGIAFRAA